MDKARASELIKKELKIAKGSGKAGLFRAGDLSEEQVKRIAAAKFGSDSEVFVSQVKGTCRSMGVSIGMGSVGDEEFRKATEKEAAAAAAPAEAASASAPAPSEKKDEKKKRKIRKGK